MIWLLLAAAAISLHAQETEPPVTKTFEVATGTKIPLGLINSISTKQAVEGDRVYLESVFPILVDGRIVIPPGSYVAGTVTQAKRAGRVKGRAELFIRFDSLTLPNGVTRDFRARVGGLDGRASEELDRNEGRIKGEGNKGGDTRTVAETSAGGAALGAIIGSSSSRAGMGAGIGAAAGATAGLVGVLMSRGPDATLPRGTTVEMVLDRPLTFTEAELDFSGAARRTGLSDGPGPQPSQRNQGTRLPGVPRRIP
jgi:type IV secretion system protein VirB10